MVNVGIRCDGIKRNFKICSANECILTLCFEFCIYVSPRQGRETYCFSPCSAVHESCMTLKSNAKSTSVGKG